MLPDLSRFTWTHPPPEHGVGERGLELLTAPGTDFWQRTHYGFRRDNGHFLWARASSEQDFTLTARVHFAPSTRYDQVGLLVRVGEGCWVKVSTEYEDAEVSRLGSVVTNGGVSDWATQDVPTRVRERSYALSYRDGDVYVAARDADDVPWRQLRIAHLHDAPGAEALQVGLYACSPQGAGFRCGASQLALGPFAPEGFG